MVELEVWRRRRCLWDAMTLVASIDNHAKDSLAHTTSHCIRHHHRPPSDHEIEINALRSESYSTGYRCSSSEIRRCHRHITSGPYISSASISQHHPLAFVSSLHDPYVAFTGSLLRWMKDGRFAAVSERLCSMLLDGRQGHCRDILISKKTECLNGQLLPARWRPCC